MDLGSSQLEQAPLNNAAGFLAKTERKIMKWTTLTFKELAAQKTLRMDAKYWIKKKASSSKQQAASAKQKKDLTSILKQDIVGLINQLKGHNETRKK